MSLKRQKAATELRDFGDGQYSTFVTRDFPNPTNYLPIVSQDFSYTMDVMHITGVGAEAERGMFSGKRITRGANIRVRDYNGEGAPDWQSALVFVETTSRKAWVYPMHSKDQREVLENFKQFLSDTGMKVSKVISDMGREYDDIKKFIRVYGEDGKSLIHYYQVNASQGHHTALSRVDRFIRTLRGLIRKYYDLTKKGNWVIMMNFLIEQYNNSVHSSLFLKDKDGYKHYYTPNQVWRNPVLRRRIKIKDYLEKRKNYHVIDNVLIPGTEVYYRIKSGRLKYMNHKGFLSQYPAIIRRKVGNSFRIQLKCERDIELDRLENNTKHYSGKIVLVPYRDLYPKSKVKPPNKIRSKYKLYKKLKEMEKEWERVNVDEEEEEESDSDSEIKFYDEEEEDEEVEPYDIKEEDEEVEPYDIKEEEEEEREVKVERKPVKRENKILSDINPRMIPKSEKRIRKPKIDPDFIY